MKKSILSVLFAATLSTAMFTSCKKDKLHKVQFKANGVETHCSINDQEVEFNTDYNCKPGDVVRVSALHPVAGNVTVEIYVDYNLESSQTGPEEVINLYHIRK